MREIKRNYELLCEAMTHHPTQNRAKHEATTAWLRTELPNAAYSIGGLHSDMWTVILERTKEDEIRQPNTSIAHALLQSAITFL